MFENKVECIIKALDEKADSHQVELNTNSIINVEQRSKDRDTDLKKHVENEIEKLKIEVSRQLVEFHKEITDKYFYTLEKILRVHTESSIVTALAHQVNEKDLNNLKSSLLQPFLQAKWDNDKAEKGQKILNKGVAIVEERTRLHNEILALERQGMNVNNKKERLAAFDWMLSEINGEIKK